MRRMIQTLAALALLGLLGAAAVVGLGLYNVSAQVGHMPGVSWVLHTTFRNSVKLRAPSMEAAPDLSDPDLVALGAGHYATACAPCHASPGTDRSATMRAMNPVPPRIEEAIGDWAPNHLHWIVENGVKMSGMPAWPAAHRGDEVWAVVAYLVALREGTAGDLPTDGPEGEARAYCATCHGRVGGRVPRLDLQDPGYLAAQLRAYADGTRPSGIMAQAVSLVPEAAHAELAAYFASAKGPEDVSAATGADTAEGAELAQAGTREVPACAACHEGPEPRKGPVLDGQTRAFLDQQLRLWRDGTYAHDKLMSAAARELTDDDIAALAAYYAGRR